MTVPYTYLIRHIPSGMMYYGCRYAKGCDPQELWDNYFTSSKIVKSLIESDGKDAFTFAVRKTFKDQLSARLWEHKVLRRLKVVDRNDFLNMTDNISISPEAASKGRSGKIGLFKMPDSAKIAIGKANTGRVLTAETKRKMSKAHLGKVSNRKGVTLSEETKRKMSKAHLGKKQSSDFSDKIKAQLIGRKLFINNLGQKNSAFRAQSLKDFSSTVDLKIEENQNGHDNSH